MTELNVLLYHGVIPDELELNGENSSGKHVLFSDFYKQMKYVSEKYNLVTMFDIADHISGKKKIDNDSVAVTFDDGFLNNYKYAWQVLENFKVPATFYLSTGFISEKKKIWTDTLEIIFLNSKNHSINYFDNEKKSIIFKNNAERVEKLRIMKNNLKSKPNSFVEKFMKYIVDNNFNEKKNEPDIYDFMNWNQIREMNESSLITFGAHTVNHVSLTKVDIKRAKWEIEKSISDLSYQLNQNEVLFSYPEGQEEDINDEIISILKHKINHCPSAIKGKNNLENLDPFYIHRTMVGFNNQAFPL